MRLWGRFLAGVDLSEAGLDTAQRAHGLWKQKLESYQAPDLGEGTDEALLDLILRRRVELPDGFE